MLNQEWVDAIDGFLRHDRASGNRKTTQAARKQQLEHLARRVVPGPWELSPEELRDYVAAQDWMPETRRGRRTTFVQFYAWALADGLVTESPADRLPKVKMTQGRARPAPDRVYREAVMAARPRERLMLRLAAEVGMRRAEVAQVHSNDLMEDLVGWSLVVHGKGGRERVVPLPASLAGALRGLPPGFAFPGNDHGHLSPRYVGKRLAELMPDGWTMHTLRHRFATRLYALRSDLLLVQEALGHANPATTRRYVEYDKSRIRSAIEELAS